MSTRADEFLQGWESRMGRAKAAAPDVPRAFGGMFAALMKEGALSAREKELIALGMAMAQRCEPCLLLHTRKALQAGATREQILETAGVAVMMLGGPGYTLLPTIVEAVDAAEQVVK